VKVSDPDQDTTTGYLVVHVGAGLVLAGIAELVVGRFGGLSVLAIFLAGWTGHVLFNALINAVTDGSALARMAGRKEK
jgi:hypothetical protein